MPQNDAESDSTNGDSQCRVEVAVDRSPEERRGEDMSEKQPNATFISRAEAYDQLPSTKAN